MHYFWKRSIKSMSCFNCFCRSCVELLSSSASIPAQWLRRSFRTSKLRCKFTHYCDSKLRFGHFHLIFTLRSQTLQSINERWHQVTWIRIPEEKGFLYQVGRCRYRHMACPSKSIVFFRCPWNLHLPHRVTQNRKWPCC